MNIAQIIDAGQGWRLNDLFTVHRLINQAIAYENGLLKTRQKDLAESTSLSNKLSNLFSFLALSVLLAAFLSNRASSRRRQLLEGFLESILNTSLNGIVNLQAIRGQDRVVDFKIAYANAAINDLLQLNPMCLKTVSGQM